MKKVKYKIFGENKVKKEIGLLVDLNGKISLFCCKDNDVNNKIDIFIVILIERVCLFRMWFKYVVRNY